MLYHTMLCILNNAFKAGPVLHSHVVLCNRQYASLMSIRLFPALLVGMPKQTWIG